MSAPGEANVLLSPAAVAQIRETLIAAIEHRGGEVEEYGPEPGMPDDILELEAKARSALALLPPA